MPAPGDWEKIIAPAGSGVRINVKITPGASRTKILGPNGDALKIAIAAPPEKGKANQALVEFLAETLGVSRQSITVQTGHTSPRKVLLIAGVTADQCRQVLSVGG